MRLSSEWNNCSFGTVDVESIQKKVAEYNKAVVQVKSEHVRIRKLSRSLSSPSKQCPITRHSYTAPGVISRHQPCLYSLSRCRRFGASQSHSPALLSALASLHWICPMSSCCRRARGMKAGPLQVQKHAACGRGAEKQSAKAVASMASQNKQSPAMSCAVVR